jgi:hypothetical protein
MPWDIPLTRRGLSPHRYEPASAFLSEEREVVRLAERLIDTLELETRIWSRV